MKKFLKGYDAEYYSERVIVSKRHIMKFIKMKQKDVASIKLLDIGCGQGYYVQDAVSEGLDALGIDVSQAAIDNPLPDVKERIQYGSITDIPFENNQFNVLTIFDVIEHIHPKDTLKMMIELNRVLVMGGFAIITTPNAGFVGDWVYDLTHINVRPALFWKRMLEEHGFKVKMPYVPSHIKHFLNKPFPVHDRVEFALEEPIRSLLGYYYLRKGRLYLVATKITNLDRV